MYYKVKDKWIAQYGIKNCFFIKFLKSVTLQQKPKRESEKKTEIYTNWKSVTNDRYARIFEKSWKLQRVHSCTPWKTDLLKKIFHKNFLPSSFPCTAVHKSMKRDFFSKKKKNWKNLPLARHCIYCNLNDKARKFSTKTCFLF